MATSEKLKAATLQTEVTDLKTQIAAAQANESGKISLERAKLEVIKYAQQNLAVYDPQGEPRDKPTPTPAS